MRTLPGYLSDLRVVPLHRVGWGLKTEIRRIPFSQSPSQLYFWAKGNLVSQLDVKGIIFFEGPNLILKELTKGALLALLERALSPVP